MVNLKSAAWDSIGDLFWEKGRKSARPSEYELEVFINNIEPGQRVCVIGASTKELVESLVNIGAQVTVYDFSRGMCESLRAAISNPNVVIKQLDICSPLDYKLNGSQDFVLNDRLINRFNAHEALNALHNMNLLTGGIGEVRASIKLGFYPMDLRMIKLGRERGTLNDFFNQDNRTIDFSAAGNILEEALVKHGDINAEILLDWYRGRASEKRFEHDDVIDMVSQVTLPNGEQLKVEKVEAFPDAISTNLYYIRAK